jgi:hypothetical protein
LQPDDFTLNCDRKNDSARTTFTLEIEKIPEFTAGDKMFLNPRIYKIWNGILPSDEKRLKPFYFEFPFIKTDTTLYQLPQDYTIENLPKDRNVHFDYGTFVTQYKYDDKANTITSTATLTLNRNIIPAEKFSDAKKFFSNVIQEYTEKIVIKKK